MGNIQEHNKNFSSLCLNQANAEKFQLVLSCGIDDAGRLQVLFPPEFDKAAITQILLGALETIQTQELIYTNHKI